MTEHSEWDNFFHAYRHFRSADKEHIETARAQLKIMANRYLTTIKSLDHKDIYVKNVHELMEAVLETIDKGNYEQIAIKIDAIGKDRIKMPHKIGFIEWLFGSKTHHAHQGTK
jgi:hypothetical protein